MMMAMNTFVPLKEWFWIPHDKLSYPCDWSNCTGPHLIVVAPNGRRWDVDHRAYNCGAPKDNEHRCWLRWGDAPFFTINKSGGLTCDAGAGSILFSYPTRWHGFLRNGNWYEDGWPPEADKLLKQRMKK